MFNELRVASETQNLLTMAYADVKKILSNLYEPETNECLQRFAFRERKQKPNESILEYVLALRNLAQKCKFTPAELNSQLKDQLISGVKNQLMRYELLKVSSKPLSELIELAKNS